MSPLLLIRYFKICCRGQLPSLTRSDCLERRLISHNEIQQWQVNQGRGGTPLEFIDLCKFLSFPSAPSSGRSKARVAEQQPRSEYRFAVLLKDTSAGWMSADKQSLNPSPSVKSLSPATITCCQPPCFQRWQSFVILKFAFLKWRSVSSHTGCSERLKNSSDPVM